MNVWDIIILLIIAGIIAGAILLIRGKKNSGCHGSCSDCASCCKQKAVTKQGDDRPEKND